MKKICKWYNKLPEPYRTQALGNLMYRVSQKKVDNFSDALKGGFVWAETDEGFSYWDNIHDRYEKD